MKKMSFQRWLALIALIFGLLLMFTALIPIGPEMSMSFLAFVGLCFITLSAHTEKMADAKDRIEELEERLDRRSKNAKAERQFLEIFFGPETVSPRSWNERAHCFLRDLAIEIKQLYRLQIFLQRRSDLNRQAEEVSGEIVRNKSIFYGAREVAKGIEDITVLDTIEAYSDYGTYRAMCPKCRNVALVQKGSKGFEYVECPTCHFSETDKR